MVKNAETVINSVLKYLPCRIAEEIVRIAEARKCKTAGIREIRIRADGRSSVLILRECIPLFNTVTREETSEIVRRLSDGALYAQRDSIASGYISLSHGVRVGVCGYARYEYRSFVGVSDLRSLVFRVPTGECEFSEELFSAFSKNVRRGMLIYSPPGVGKTTALRSLAKSIGGGRYARRVAVIDERCEFSEEDFSDCEVDILKGYKRKTGIEIATRTMSPEVIIIDEIGAEEATGVAQAIRTGVPLVATSHAASLEEVLSKPSLAPLFECSAFDTLVGISYGSEGYRLSVDRV